MLASNNTVLVANASEKSAASQAFDAKLQSLYSAHARATVGALAGDPFAAREKARTARLIELYTEK